MNKKYSRPTIKEFLLLAVIPYILLYYKIKRWVTSVSNYIICSLLGHNFVLGLIPKTRRCLRCDRLFHIDELEPHYIGKEK